MAASLTSLPVELLTYILMNLQSPRDLYHTIQASSTCYRVFQVYRVSIFSRILSNFFHRDVTQDALCALYASRTLNLPNVAPLQLREMLATFLREYHSGTLAFPGNFEDLSSLGRAWARVDAFVLDYITGSSVVQARQLRATGDTRLRKAFFRLAIFYSCSWVDRRVCDFLDMGFHRNGRMNELFFGPMSWTEISSTDSRQWKVIRTHHIWE
ncbi:hypothetical protein M426DRAFT_7947 [Hypoxylon sp. CI-4A]|nr:hypothetical protein M426DRAFT_7947 [Hypoxylon sp. CI-4A]